LDWTDFAQRLTRELMHLPIDAFVIVQGPGGLPYVQAMRYRNGLHAEAVSSDYLPEPLTAKQESRLSQMGWLAPDGQARRNWWCRVMLPADIADITPEQAAECGELADRMVGAFSDVYGISSVAELTYEASRGGEQPAFLPMPGLGIPAAGTPAEEELLSWTEFTEQLAGELASMEPEMVIVISHRLQESYYVQAFRDAQRVRAEAVSGRALPPSAPAFDARTEERLAAAGWRPPGEHPNWTCELPAGASPEEYRRLAAMMVTALRDVQLAGNPADLVYEAFIGASHVELTEFGIPLADPARVDVRRASRPLPGRTPPEQPPPAAEQAPAAGFASPAAAAPLSPSDVEAELVAAKSRGDQAGYLGVLLRCVLYVPVTEDGQPVTADYRDGTYVLAFTSPEDMDWALGGKLMDYRRTTFTELALNWQRPDWQLAINTRLPSAAYIDTSTILQTAERARGGSPVPPASRAPAADSPGPERTGRSAAESGTVAWSALVKRPDEPAAGQGSPAEDETAAPSSESRSGTADALQGDPAEKEAVAAGTGRSATAADSPKDRSPAADVLQTGASPNVAPSPPPDRPAEPAQQAGDEAAGPSAPHEPSPAADALRGDPPPRVAEGPAAGRSAAPSGAREQAGDKAADDVPEAGVVMQKVIRPDHVVHYLEGGYDWVAGRIYRLQDVSGLRTAGQLIGELGLDREGSAFSPGDAQVFVIRWPVLKPALLRPVPPAAGSTVPAFRTGSQRLPHGAEMFAIDQLGNETFLAVYDADVRGWIRIEEAVQ